MLIDSYPTSNYSGIQTVNGTNNKNIGQSFYNSESIDYTIDYIDVYLKKNGSPSGSAYIQLWSHTGVYGSLSGKPNILLATSDPFEISNLSTSFELKSLTFSSTNKIKLDKNTPFCFIVISPTGTASDYIILGLDNSSPTHSGRFIVGSPGSWLAYNSLDLIFYVYGTPYIWQGQKTVLKSKEFKPVLLTKNGETTELKTKNDNQVTITTKVEKVVVN